MRTAYRHRNGPLLTQGAVSAWWLPLTADGVSQPDAGAAAVLVDEDDAGRLKGGPYGLSACGAGGTAALLKVTNSTEADRSRVGQHLLRPS